MYMPKFYNLIPYKKCMGILLDLVEEISTYEVFKIKIYLVKIMKHIAHSQAVLIYPNTQQYQYKEVLKWLYKAEKEIKVLNICDIKKNEYKKELNQVRKLLIVLNKKVKVEEDKIDEEKVKF